MGTTYQNRPDSNRSSTYNAEGCYSKPAAASTQWQRQSMISHQVFDTSQPNKAPWSLRSSQTDGGNWLGSMTTFHNFSSQYDGFGHSASMGFGHSLPSTNCVNNHQLPQGLPYNDEHIASRFIASDRNNLFSSLGTKPVSAKFAASPEQLSSITACSEADCYSDGDYLDSGSTFSGIGFKYATQSSLENYIPRQAAKQGKLGSIDHGVVLYHCFPESFVVNGELSSILEKIPERRSNSLSSVVSGEINRRHEYQFQLPSNSNISKQSVGLRKKSNSLSDVVAGRVMSMHGDHYKLPQFYHLTGGFQFDQLFKPQRWRVSLGNQCQNSKFKESSFNPDQVPVNQMCESQQQEPCVLQRGPSNQIDSSNMASKDVLCSHYKTLSENKGENQAGRMHISHKKLCEEKKGKCEWHQNGLSHNENLFCSCTLGKPVEELGSVKCSTTAMFEDAPPPKRARTMKELLHPGRDAVLEDQSFRCGGTSDYKNLFVGSLCNGKNEEVMTMVELSCSQEASIQTTKKDSHSPEILIQSMKSDKLYSPDDTVRGLDSTDQISDNDERLQCDNSFFPEVLNNEAGDSDQLNSDEAVLEQPDVIQEPRDTKYMSKPEKKPNIIQEPKDIECASGPQQLGPKAEIDQSRATASHHLRTTLGDFGKLTVSFVDFLSFEQIEEHICSVRQSMDEPCMKKSEENTMENCAGESTCQLCSMDRLVFGPAPLYCSYCCSQIKLNSTYYWTPDEISSRLCFCAKCFKVSRGSSISLQGRSISKAQLWKERHFVEIEESWVQCDKCECWLHQICGLYNAKRDAEGKAKYICPYCRLEEIKMGEHVPFLVLGARDLPSTMLSDHIERRLSRKLKREKEERAKFLNKDIDEVSGAGEIVVRVVSSVRKILKVKKQFLDIFPDEDYPTEFPYGSKVILMFEKIEGIDICLFCMYVQEFGSDCDQPNERTVYVSYLDSIKYFHPEIKTVTGEALRTFVYHEILIGYLDYCKRRGFATCHIWACPPTRKEDYIFNCHPESQKIPRADKLKQWYKSMLKKAVKDDVVVDYTTLYESFFTQNGEGNNKITAARLPYFEGSYWSGAAEEMMGKMEKESSGVSGGKVKKPLTKRTLKAMGHKDDNIDTTKDILVMQKLGQNILPSKENFLVVRLLFTCKNCHNLILSGVHWFCNQCKIFYFCSRCLEVEQNLKGRNMHTSSDGAQHLLSQVVINDLPTDTAEKDVVLDNNIFEERHSFLHLCQGNNYQFDTLRRAKHSSLMILHDLHKQILLARKIACGICHKDIPVDARWYCEICTDFFVCDNCWCKDRASHHDHKLILHFPRADCGVNENEAWPEKADEERFRKAFEHASQCRGKTVSCTYPQCPKIKWLFHHSTQCSTRIVGGCELCLRMWTLVRLHSVRCKDSKCRLPRCRDVKIHIGTCTRRCMFCFCWRQLFARHRGSKSIG